MATSEEKALTLSQHFDMLEDLMEDGPEDNQSSSAFLRNLTNEARLLVGVLESLSESDIDEIWQEDETAEEL